MEMESCVPPGFRFHPTEEELVGYYLKRKVNSLKIDLDVIIDIDLYRIEPWDIQDKCKLGYDEQNEWYFFSHKDRKYPTGTRTNRATAAGFWKATGRDKAVLSKEKIIGMRKTLVFYKGRAPNGRKTDWIMHEYRLQTSEHGPPQEEGWVVCRAFKKPNPAHKQGFEAWNNAYGNYVRDSNNYRMPSYPTTPSIILQTFDPLSHENTNFAPFAQPETSVKSCSSSHMNMSPFDNSQLVDLPKLDSPSISNNFEHGAVAHDQDIEDDQKSSFGNQYSDWKSFDKLLATQGIGSSSYGYSNMPLLPHNDELDAQNPLSHVLQCFPDL